MNDEILIEIGLKAAFEKAKQANPKEIKMTEDDAALYWFSCGFKMGHAFARFVDRQKGKADEN